MRGRTVRVGIRRFASEAEKRQTKTKNPEGPLPCLSRPAVRFSPLPTLTACQLSLDAGPLRVFAHLLYIASRLAAGCGADWGVLRSVAPGSGLPPTRETA